MLLMCHHDEFLGWVNRVSTPETVTQAVVSQVKRLRRRRGLTSAALAERCAALGAPEVTDNVIRNIEVGRRTISVDQLAVLALALDVAPPHLLTPPDQDGQDGSDGVQVTSTVTADRSTWASWVRGNGPLPAGNESAFWAYALESTSDTEEGRALIDLARARTTAATGRVAMQLQAEAQARLEAVNDATDLALAEIERAVRNGASTDAVLESLERARRAARSSPRDSTLPSP